MRRASIERRPLDGVHAAAAERFRIDVLMLNLFAVGPGGGGGGGPAAPLSVQTSSPGARRRSRLLPDGVRAAPRPLGGQISEGSLITGKRWQN